MKNNLLLILYIFSCISINLYAQGDLFINPSRVVFEGRKSKQSLNLVNTGNETTTYSVSFVQRRMNEDGSFTAIKSPGDAQNFADPYLRIYPRQITLEPGEGQVIKLQFRRKPEMTDGEYRSHLYFRSEKNYTPLGTKKSDSTKLLSVQIIPIYGISIPVIIRRGHNNTKASFSDLKLESKTDPILSFTLNRTGDYSTYGNLIAEFITDKGINYQIGVVNGVAVYTTIKKRYVSIKLNSSSKELKNGKIRLRYVNRKNVKNQEVYAEAILEM